jgi:addiction module HigA family antidote
MLPSSVLKEERGRSFGRGLSSMKFKRFSNPFHPGEILLEEFLEPNGLSQRAFAKQLGWTPRKLNEIIKAKRGITALTAPKYSQDSSGTEFPDRCRAI